MNLNRALTTNCPILCTHMAIPWLLFADDNGNHIFLCWQIVIMEKQTLTEERQTTLHSWEKVQWKKGLCVERSYRGPLLENLPSEYSSNATLSWAWRLKSVKCSEVEEQERRGKQIDSAAVSIFLVILVELTNTVFVNSTNITTNIETAVRSRGRVRPMLKNGCNFGF